MPKGHKDNCLCSVCQQRRKNIVAIIIAPTLPVAPAIPVVAPKPPEVPDEVPVGSLRVGARFLFRGERYQAGITEANMRFAISPEKPYLGIKAFSLTDLVKVIK